MGKRVSLGVMKMFWNLTEVVPQHCEQTHCHCSCTSKWLILHQVNFTSFFFNFLSRQGKHYYYAHFADGKTGLRGSSQLLVLGLSTCTLDLI